MDGVYVFDGVTLVDVLQGSWHIRALISNMVFDNTFYGVSGPATWFAYSSTVLVFVEVLFTSWGMCSFYLITFVFFHHQLSTNLDLFKVFFSTIAHRH